MARDLFYRVACPESGRNYRVTGKKGLEAFALHALTLHLAGAADSLSGFARTALRGLLIMAAELHLAEHAFTLKLLFQRLQRLIDVIITDENLHLNANSNSKILKNKRLRAPRGVPAANLGQPITQILRSPNDFC